jgi:hypothetical protein
MKTNMMPATCLCGEEVVKLDDSRHSSTMCCPRCRHGVLVINHPDFRVTIVLVDFCRKRGDGPQQRPLDDLQIADSLVDSLVMEQWPSAAVVLSFGIESPQHYDALAHAVCIGISAYDLDRVQGDGRALTCLTRSLPGQPHPNIKFASFCDEAAWD